jgi:hypothetical protein
MSSHVRDQTDIGTYWTDGNALTNSGTLIQTTGHTKTFRAAMSSSVVAWQRIPTTASSAHVTAGLCLTLNLQLLTQPVSSKWNSVLLYLIVPEQRHIGECVSAPICDNLYGCEWSVQSPWQLYKEGKRLRYPMDEDWMVVCLNLVTNRKTNAHTGNWTQVLRFSRVGQL